MFYKAVVVAGWQLGALVGLAAVAILLVEGSSRARRRGRRRLAWLAVAAAWLTLPLALVAWVSLYRCGERPVYPDSVLDSEMLLVEVLALAAANCLAVLAIWSVFGRGHWFLRMLVVVGVIALPVLIPACELVLMVSVQSAVTIVPLLAIRFFLGTERSVRHEAGPEGERPPRPAGPRRGQFALRDLLLGTVLVAILLGIAVAVPGTLWSASAQRARFVPPGVTPAPAPGVFFGAWGAVFGLGALVAAWVALRRGPLWSRLPAVVPAVPMVPAMLWLALWRGSSGRWRWPARVTLALLSLVLLAPPAMVYYCLVTPPPVVPKPVLPEPNGYVLAIEAAEALANVRTPEPTDRKAVKVAFQAAHGATIDKARRALDYPACVPLQFSYVDIEVTDVMHLRQLARALNATADLAVQEGRLSDAVACHADVVRLGRVLERGGLPVQRLVGMVIEGIGLQGLHRLPGSLTPEQCRAVASVLASVQADRESLEEVLARDEAWNARALGWQGRLSWLLAPLYRYAYGTPHPSHFTRAGEAKYTARVRIVLAELAVRAYLVEQGRLPGQLADLVPAYLPAVPEDPTSGEPLVYRREGAGYRVSSSRFSDEELWGPPPAASAKDDSADEPPKEQDPG